MGGSDRCLQNVAGWRGQGSLLEKVALSVDGGTAVKGASLPRGQPHTISQAHQTN